MPVTELELELGHYVSPDTFRVAQFSSFSFWHFFSVHFFMAATSMCEPVSATVLVCVCVRVCGLAFFTYACLVPQVMQSMRHTAQTDKGAFAAYFVLSHISLHLPVAITPPPKAPWLLAPPQAKKLSIIERLKTLATIIICFPGGKEKGVKRLTINKGTHQTWQCRIKFNFRWLLCHNSTKQNKGQAWQPSSRGFSRS